MKTRLSLLIPLLCILLVVVAIRSTAQDVSIAPDSKLGIGPEPGMSDTGASILPDDLPQIKPNRHRLPPRGLERDFDDIKNQLPPAGPLPANAMDPSILAGESPVSAPTLVTNFQGIGFTGWIPPDNAVAAGPNHVIHAVNESLRISTKTGTTLSTTTFASWWSLAISVTSAFDPHVIYDQHSNRWVLLTVAADFAKQKAWYLISTSYTSDPTQQWCVWALDATLDGSTPSTNWADFPQLGVDDQAFYITSNQFSFVGFGTFQYSKLRVMAKSQFYNNTCGTIVWADFVNMLNADGSPAFTLQPAHTFGTPGKEYLASASSFAGNAVTLWSVTNPTTTPTFTREATVSVGAFIAPPQAQQLGTLTPLDTGDARLLNAVYRNGFIYTAHTVSCNGLSACARYLQINVSGPTVALDETFGASGFYYFNPSIMPDPSGNIVTVFNRSSSSEFAGIRYTSRRTTDSDFQSSAALQNGVAPYVSLDNSGRNRWGDYTGIALDPINTNQVWMSSEFANLPANRWGTWVGDVDATTGTSPGPCPMTATFQNEPAAPAALTTFRRFRDEAMTQSPEGQRLIAVFNQHRWEGTQLLLGDAVLRARSLTVLRQLLPKAQAVVSGNGATLSPADVAAIDRLLRAFSAKASPSLQRTIAQLRLELRNGRLPSRFQPAGAAIPPK